MFALALVVSFAVTPEDIEAGRVVLSPACHFKATFGRECPTCGLTRAFCALSHGRLDDARRYNRASPPLYALWWAGSCAAPMRSSPRTLTVGVLGLRCTSATSPFESTCRV
ncbi:MAG TPA: DUF2752 domain-containing protein, partial [Polyangiaceae bacterium]|nr:DUF2752 domain-containing protein [Polyangiaceae bacterium]